MNFSKWYLSLALTMWVNKCLGELHRYKHQILPRHATPVESFENKLQNESTTEITTEKPIDQDSVENNNATEAQKLAISIAQRQCKIYMEERFIVNTEASLLLDDETFTERTLDCNEVEALVVNGEIAGSKEFPHMAVIGCGESRKKIWWICGGSLISDRYVLSAAHCIYNAARCKPKWILLGDLDLRTTTDDAKPETYAIIETIKHPNYRPTSGYHDIVLYKLGKTVKFSSYIRPICLYPYTKIPMTENKALVSGWGATSTDVMWSDQLQKAEVSILGAEECAKYYNYSLYYSAGFDQSSLICAADTVNGKDTCKGDSGSPLQIKMKNEQCMYLQLGLTSRGPKDCGNTVPAVYTRIGYYIEWIQSIVWPQTN